MMNNREEDIKTNSEDEELKERSGQDTEEEETSTAFDDVGRDELIELLEEREQKIEELEEKVTDAENAKLRKAAELDNYRKRVQRERSQIYNSAKVNALEDFLSISDDLKRTLHASKDMDIPQSFWRE